MMAKKMFKINMMKIASQSKQGLVGFFQKPSLMKSRG